MKRLKTVLMYSAVLILGVAAGAWWGFTQNNQFLWQQVADRESNDLINRLNTLCHHRLGQHDAVRDDLERHLDTSAMNIAFAADSSLQLKPQSMKQLHLRALQMAKAYRVAYPSADNSIQPAPSSVFDQIPPMEISPKTCNNAFCNLLSERPAQMQTPLVNQDDGGEPSK